MSVNTNTTVHSRAINAFFDNSDSARRAIDDLVAAGIPRQFISQTGGQGASTTTARADDRGFWDQLKDLFLPDEDRSLYAEGLRRGGYLVSVRTDEASYERVLDILDRDGSVDLDEREPQWRSEGWTGFSSMPGAATGAATTTSASARTTAASSSTTAQAYTARNTAVTDRALASGRTTGTGATLDASRDEVIPVYEENLQIGKRDVSHGRVRIRSYVVETPVNQQVHLRDETVVVDRKPVDRPASAGDALFQERVIEAEEFDEEAVVAKDVRVKEEITLRKTVEDRVQNVTDSVRRTEVEVDDSRGRTGVGAVGTGVGAVGTTAGSFQPSIDASRITEHMDVISADGQNIGKVDHLDGPDRIKLAKTTSPDGQHHYVPFTWIDHIDQHVHLKKTLAEIKAGL